MPKKPPANAFYFFMLDRKAHYERNGERFPNGLKDVSVICDSEWKVLPAEHRKKYEEMARVEKARLKGDTARKYTNQHRSFDSVELARVEEEELKHRMNKDIESTIRSLFGSNKIAEFKFYLIHANYFCILEGDMYFPAELAIVEFSLARGVEEVYHTIINAGSVPLGYRHEAMQKSENVHHIPLEYEEGENRFHVIWKNVKAMLERGRSAHGGSYPPLYTMPDNVNLNTSLSCVKSVMKHLSEADDVDTEEIKIYALEKLFYELKNSCAERKQLAMGDLSDGQSDYCPSIPFACDRLEDDMYNYTANIACPFHYEMDQVVNCSKSFVQRWAYLICDACCQYLDIKIVPGKHVPLKSDVSFAEKQREKEREAAASTASAAHKPFTIVGPGGKQILAFKPVEPRQQPPLPQPRVQTTVPVPRPTPTVFNPIDNSEDNFPAIPIGRGRGRTLPRGGAGRGNAPLSFAAAAQSKK